nr:immunoglobulin light chain junction region [Macaca mulatta]MOW03199.1 immunoglobulin light chain junction region [Macaca mulatta]MOW03329.1 immunoglobulin light chain junction region [Macaca mulatta]
EYYCWLYYSGGWVF